jgi:hypothetical protein
MEFAMLKLLKLFAWLLFVVVALVAVDQFLVRVPVEVAGVTQAQKFYVDFRGRLLGLVGLDLADPVPQKSIEQVIEANQQAPAPETPDQQRYLYVDDSGALQFADSLQQVPEEYRQSAQPLAE